jgi:hypothetical protein
MQDLIFFPVEKLMGIVFLQDYGIDFDDDDQPVELFRCKCGSKFCRNMKRSNSKFNLLFVCNVYKFVLLST